MCSSDLASLRALHPFIPFLTEELWHRVPRPPGSPISLALASYPNEASAPRDLDVERDMASVQAVISAARALRSEHEVHPGAEIPLVLRTDDVRVAALLRAETRAIRTLVKTVGDPTIEPRGGDRPRGAVMSVAADAEVLVPLKGLVDPAKEAARVERELKKTDKDIAAIEKKLALPSFADKAPPEVVVESKAQLDELRRKRVALDEALRLAAELGDEAK